MSVAPSLGHQPGKRGRWFSHRTSFWRCRGGTSSAWQDATMCREIFRLDLEKGWAWRVEGQQKGKFPILLHVPSHETQWLGCDLNWHALQAPSFGSWACSMAPRNAQRSNFDNFLAWAIPKTCDYHTRKFRVVIPFRLPFLMQCDATCKYEATTHYQNLLSISIFLIETRFIFDFGCSSMNKGPIQKDHTFIFEFATPLLSRCQAIPGWVKGSPHNIAKSHDYKSCQQGTHNRVAWQCPGHNA